MEQLQYHPSAIARGLSRKCMDTVGVVLTETFTSPLMSPYYAAVINGVFEAASEAHQSVLFSPSQTREDVLYGVKAHREGRCDGLLLFVQKKGSGLVDRLLDAGTPFVLVGDTCEDARVASVDVDNVLASAQIVSYLLEQGHRRIAFLSGNIEHSSASRLEGYQSTLKSWGVEVSSELILSGGIQEDIIRNQVKSLINLPVSRRPTALCCYNDDIALVALSAIRELGLRVPEDMSVTGFDDIPSAAQAGLTTMRQPLVEIGRQSMTRLLGQIRDETPRGGATLLPVKLTIRDSVAPV
jgi:DNA-binding LacI/PurR family transcriptional regulator